MGPPGGLKAAAKRTAFGDVSNTAKTLIIHDDSIIHGRSNKSDLVKPLAHPDKPAALLRPAQRPLNAAPVKGLLPTTSVPLSIPVATKAPHGDSQLHMPAPKRTLSKKGRKIYKDNVQDVLLHAPIAPPAAVRVVKEELVAPAPVHQILEPRQHKSQPQLKPEQPVLRRTQSRYLENGSNALAPILPSDPIYEDAHEEQGITSDEAYENYLTMAELEEEKARIQQAPHSANDHVKRQSSGPIAEPEEYWEDDEEEIYDEQGYTTAHSYRSRGDNTTGGATTVLFPKVTNKTKKEIQDAAILVESTRTQDDIEDEAWDTSMVAEYGDEIFAYMRELEVST